VSGFGGSADCAPERVSDAKSRPLLATGRSGLLDEIGEDNLRGNAAEAVPRAREKVGG
jgi:hypothetical protein